MRLWRTVLAEILKLVGLPSLWAGAAVAILVTSAITVLHSMTTLRAIADHETGRLAYGGTSPFETGFAAMPLATVGAVVIGVVAASSEYTSTSADAGGGRQITMTLAAMPSRWTLVGAKAVAVVGVLVAIAAVTIATNLALAQTLLGDMGSETVDVSEALERCLGATVYWVSTGLLALGIALAARSGLVPLVVLIVNSSVVSVSLLLTNVTGLAHWLPDLAGRRLFGGEDVIPGGLAVVPGGLVMAAWSLLALGIGGWLLHRRDA